MPIFRSHFILFICSKFASSHLEISSVTSIVNTINYGFAHTSAVVLRRPLPIISCRHKSERKAMALVRLIVAVALLNLCFLHSGVALRWQEDCIDAPQDQPCFNVRNDWARFRAKVERANDGETIVFCPFEVTSDGTGVRPKTKASLVCQHQHSCIVRGPGRLMHLHRTMTEVSVVGFRFEGATDAAVYISQRSRKKQSFCKCEFAR